MGNPTQLVRVLISTAGQATGVVIVDGCPSKTTDCEESRGGLFNPNSSNTWKPQGNYTLGLEANNGYGDITAMYGYDTLSLGLSKATGGPSLKSQVVAGLVSQDFKLGLFGLGNQPTNFTGLDDSHPSFLTNLKAKNLIPSLSWSYTAGAYYSE